MGQVKFRAKLQYVIPHKKMGFKPLFLTEDISFQNKTQALTFILLHGHSIDQSVALNSV